VNRLGGRILPGLVTPAIVIGLAGCGAAAPGAGVPAPASSATVAAPTLPPRPVELRLDGVNPCSLLTDAQAKQQLDTNGGFFGADEGGSPVAGDMCLWSNFPRRPDNEWSATTVLHQGAEFALGKEPLRTVDNFAATSSGSTAADPARYCGMLVDVAPGQSLLVSYDNSRKDDPAMNHQLACDKAQQAAEMMITNLRAIKHR
jgi:hypothetical protein